MDCHVRLALFGEPRLELMILLLSTMTETDSNLIRSVTDIFGSRIATDSFSITGLFDKIKISAN